MGVGIILLTNVQDFIIVVLAIYRKLSSKKTPLLGVKLL